MADHLPVFLLQYGGQWNDITSDVSQADPLAVNRIASEVGDAPKASSVDLTLEDPAGRYRIHNPTSPLYGITGRNTPLIVADAVLTEDFETFPLGITVSAGASVNGWARSTTSPYSGGWCFKSGATANSAFSDAIITVPAGANACLLRYRTDSQAGDVLRISSGGVLRQSVSGTGGAWAQLLVPCVPNSLGAREIYLRYLKDAAGAAGADAVYVDNLRFLFARTAAEVSSWRPERSLGFTPGQPRGRQTCGVTAEGLLRRIGNWTDVLQSAMTRSILARSRLIGAWPGEDGREATAMSNLVAGGRPAIANRVNFGEDESPGGGSTSMGLTVDCYVSGVFLPSTADGMQVSWAFRLPGIPGSGTLQPLFTVRTTNNYVWQISVNATTYRLDVAAPDGSVALGTSIGFGTGGEPNQWLTMRLKATETAGTISWELSWYPEGAPVLYVPSGTFAGTVGRAMKWYAPGNVHLDGGWLAYVYAIDDPAGNLLDGAAVNSFNGFTGELVADRFQRLLREEGLVGLIEGTAADTELMGAQRPEKLYDLLAECRDTDGGLIYDASTEIAVTLRTRQDLYTQPVALALTYGVNVAAPIAPALDDQGTANQVTATQRDGGSATATDLTTSMSVLAPPAGVGLYKRDVAVNLFTPDERLEQVASWWKGQGTVPGARYPSVVVDLDANPELEAAARAVRPGDRITITGLDPDVIDLMAMSIKDVQPDQKRRLITFGCLPYRQYNVGAYDDPVKRYDSSTSTLNAGYSSTASPMVIRFTARADGWSTTAVPYDLDVAGERIRVTAMGAITGTGPFTQSATVTRSINGVVKAQASGAPVHIHPAQLARYAL